MCGINGFILNKSASVDQNINKINTMNSLITYRGPDSDGVYTDSDMALGMRRLAIIDLCTGRQPIFNEDETKVIVFNGEIYNFQGLRQELVARGHTFKTKSDTEVILHSYEEYGVDCLKKLNGMFAFAIYDIKERELFIARDRAGEKPLYYYKDQDRFVFASELKSIIKTFDIKKKIDKKALNQYFSLTYIPAPLTIFEGIFKLEAGSYMLYKNGSLTIEKYWNIDSREVEIIHNYDECKRRLREALFTSVEQKMISDVPLGAFLSGGIDSSIMVGIMSKLSERPVETFTIGFKLKEFDESDRAQIVSQKNNTNHHVHFLDYTHAIEELENILETFDEPFADSSSIPTYFVSKFAGEHVKVVLTGDAGDELFGGYSKYMVNYYTDMYNKVPRVLRKSFIEPLIYKMPDRSSISRKVRKVVESSEKDMFQKRRELMFLGFNGDRIAKLLKAENMDSKSYDIIEKSYNKNVEFDELTRTLYTDFKIVLEGDMLVKVDRMSMLNSIETRVPMLDKNVIELAFSMPSNFKISGRNQKYILKDTFKDLIPQEVLGKSKRGFAVPIGEWFKGPLKDMLLVLLSKEFILEQGIFEYEYIKKLLEDHFAERVNNAYPLWALFVFQKWYRKYYMHK
ncbi:MAG TPA: asparagine synthase (glutamine-hydrolyzing) [Pseudobacteroides sp.]|uniref:asparagine synthase (glutamine-hydrolyzing) n=1 Tax=Pseudobacteroides sp. TaxID=1968840 RepID=UPI002F9451F5